MSENPKKLTLRNFKTLISTLKSKLQEWWIKINKEINDEAAFTELPETPLYSTIPLIDSKIVIKSSPIFEDILGRKLPAKFIKPGGYDDFESMATDLINKFQQDMFAREKK